VLFSLYLVYTLSFNGSVAIVSVYTLEMLPQGGVGDAEATHTWVGVVSMALPIGSALAMPLWGRLLDRFGPPRVLVGSLLLATLAMLAMPIALAPAHVAVARLLFGALAVGIGPAAITQVKLRAPLGMESRVLAYLTAFGMLGMGVGPFIAGQMGPALGLRSYFGLNALMLLACLGAWYRSWTRPQRAGAQD